MCGIVGAFDLSGRREFPRQRMLQMTGALAHRGPDDEQLHLEPGIALGVRRLAVIDIAGGRQPLCNENGDVWVAYEGELYQYPELRKELLSKGHTLATHCDTEAWVHLYEDLGEEVFLKAEGQFGVSLWDQRKRKLFLARDRIGISPLFYARSDGWLLWASEIKALLASGMVAAHPDRKGLDYFFNFFCLPMDRTCFDGIRSVKPGHYLCVKDGQITQRQYWDLDFPDKGDERRYQDPETAAEELEDVLRGAIRRRLVGEVPLSCYISGGLDSTVLLGLGTQERGEPIPSFTAGLDKSGPVDERFRAAESAKLLNSELTTLNITQRDIADTFPKLILASEGPVLDTSAACMILLAAANRAAGNTVVLTGEGSDEALGGYIWYKWHRLQLLLNRFGFPLDRAGRNIATSILIGGGSAHRAPFYRSAGIRTAQQAPWDMMGQSRETLYSADMWQWLDGYSACDDLPTPDRVTRWHPLNQSLYHDYKVLLPGLLMCAKGDRATRSASTEGRYPYLDERYVEFCASLAPEYKLRGLTDKWLLRRVAAKNLPKQISGRPKTMFRANMGKAFLGPERPPWIDQLLSRESLLAAGYFDPEGVRASREMQQKKPRKSLRRFSLDMGLAGVISTQLWHHLYCGGGLADLPTWSPPNVAETQLHVTGAH